MEDADKPENCCGKIKCGHGSTSDRHKKQSPGEKPGRKICSRCQRPAQRACICAALPPEPILLENCNIVVLQHPHELKLKNRSVPLLELCLHEKSLDLCVGRKLREDILPSKIRSLLEPPNLPILLFPDTKTEPGTVSLSDAKSIVKKEFTPGRKIVLIGIDATWKYAQEMHRANLEERLYPPHLIRVSLQADDFPEDWTVGRFNIRTTPQAGGASKSFMSTAECIAWAVSELGGEQNYPELYSILMKPLDLMVQKWNSFVEKPKRREKLPPRKKQKKA
eukprot:scaffold22766_cov131-Cylindrotheca_fusiformis.AAC.2